ncbi:MAG TPA: very short patch repair endonuclease [Candidatus Dormibacteraeota bacterium]|nr:very short patch repair endonuclease [Candidatus Dormibacteraeota bacterium]
MLTPTQRSYCMSRIRGKDTKPEYLVRKGLHALGFRYRLHQRNLPGCPDLVLSKHRAVIFVHGCLWHRHKCHLFQWPRTNALFWRRKITKNCENDEKNLLELRSKGWRVMTVWECALRGKRRLEFSDLIQRIVHWLSSPRKRYEIAGS